jgi:GNAT superfamily N-acetyltransferase
MTDLEIATVTDHDDEGLLDEFHAGVYWDDTADNPEPVAVWKRALWGGVAPYQLTVRIAGRALRDRERREIVGGVVFERYPRSGCGLLTYMVVAPAARRQGLGRRLQHETAAELFAAGARAVFTELSDPRHIGDRTDEPAHDRWRRIVRNQAWGARVLDIRYVQPALAPGLVRGHGLCLAALSGGRALPASLPGPIVRDFLDELFSIAEGASPEPAMLAEIPDRVALIELGRPDASRPR